MSRPNVLYINSHDTGRYIQPYGYAIATPNLQRLAEEGVLMRQAFCAGPTCSASRAALVTGMWCHSNGMITLSGQRGRATLNDYGQHLVATLKKAGYQTVLAGNQHVAENAQTIGYDSILPVKDMWSEDTVTAAVDFLAHRPPEPFYLEVGLLETHRMWEPPKLPFTPHGPNGDSRYRMPPAIFPDTPQTRQDWADFILSAGTLDRKMGAIFAALEANGLADNTLIVCTTDHGVAFPNMKCNLTNHGTGVMLIVRGPGGFSGGKVCDAMVSQIDIFPTLCETLEIDPPSWLQGRSMMPLIRGQKQEINEEVFSEVTYHAAYEPMRGVRTKRWNYIRRYDGRTRPVLPNCDDGLTKTYWLDNGWRDRKPLAEQLYDLVFDPQEVNNVAGQAELAPVLQEMRGRLDRWMKATDDPLLKGHVPPRPGAMLNDPDQMSPCDPLRTFA